MIGSMLNFLLNILAIVLLVVILYYAIQNLQHEGFVNPSYTNFSIKFLTAEESRKFLLNDPDEYVHTLNQWDLIARKVSTFQDYLNKIAKSTLSFTSEQKTRLSNAAKDADQFFNRTQIDGINCQEIATLPWKFALTSDKNYEDGLPHTRADIIFLSTIVDQTHIKLVRTLIHEKIHIYQRLNPEEIMNFLATHGYYQYKQRFGIPRIRSNPDLDAWIYFNPVSKEPMVAYYTSDNPTDIDDVTITKPIEEHPFEEIAYNVSQKYK